MGFTRLDAPELDAKFSWRHLLAEGADIQSLADRLTLQMAEISGFEEVQSPVISKNEVVNWQQLLDILKGNFANLSFLKDLLVDKLLERHSQGTLDAILLLSDGNALRDSYGDAVADVLTALLDNQELFKEAKTQGLVTNNVHFMRPDYASTHHAWLTFQDLKARGVLDEAGNVLKPEAVDSLRWFNLYFLHEALFYAQVLFRQYQDWNILTGLNGLISAGPKRDAFLAAHGEVIAPSELENQALVRSILESMNPELQKYDGRILTAQENLKRLIDQTIEAEEAAAAARAAGRTADYYVHLFDTVGPTGLYQGAFGDDLFKSMASLLQEYGYTTYVDIARRPIDAENPISDPALLEDLLSGNKQLAGLAGWYWLNEGEYEPMYDYLESLGGFDSGGYVTPLDSGFGSGWTALEHDRVVMATNAQFEPFIGGTATIVSAFLWTGTPLALAAAMAAPVRWAPNIFGDPLFNIGQFIVDKVKGTKEIIETGGLSGDPLPGLILGERKHRIEVVKNEAGQVINVEVGIGRETYLDDGTMIFSLLNGLSKYTYDASGRIVREERKIWQGDGYVTYTRDVHYGEDGGYAGFTAYNPDGSQEEYDFMNRRITRGLDGEVIVAEHYLVENSLGNFTSIEIWPSHLRGMVNRREYFEGNEYPLKPHRVEDIRYAYNPVTSASEEMLRQRYLQYTEDGKISAVITKDSVDNLVSTITFDAALENTLQPGTANIVYASGGSTIKDFNHLYELFDYLYPREPADKKWMNVLIRYGFSKEIMDRIGSSEGQPKYLEAFDLDGNGAISVTDLVRMSSFLNLPEADAKMAIEKIMNLVGERIGSTPCKIVHDDVVVIIEGCVETYISAFDVNYGRDVNGDGVIDGDSRIDETDFVLIRDALMEGRMAIMQSITDAEALADAIATNNLTDYDSDTILGIYEQITTLQAAVLPSAHQTLDVNGDGVLDINDANELLAVSTP
jgi:hypothetical protein